MENQKLKKVKLKIHGMHCASCEVLIERKFKKVDGVEKVTVNHASGKAELVCLVEPNIRKLNDLVKEDGYQVTSWEDRNKNMSNEVVHKNTLFDYLQMVYIFLIIIVIYLVLEKFNFLPNISITQHMSYGLIFLIGLFAAVSSCIAVVGGLLLTLTAKYNEANPNLTGIQKFKPHIYFNIGRILGYTVFGALVGALGSELALSPSTNGYLMVIVSLVMLMLGFQLLNLFPWLQRFSPKMPKFISHKIHDLSSTDSKGAPLTLGALTFFLPCGFTQALQLYVLASGSWKVGALTMLVFSLGTLPALLSLSAVSSFVKGVFQKHFLRFAGVLIIMLSIFNINNGLALAGFNLSSVFSSSSASPSNIPTSPIVDGKQIIKMAVNGYTYTPSRFTVVAGVPVEWQIDGTNAEGCARVVVISSLGISKYLLPAGITTITFTPNQTGLITFNCPMGMTTRGAEFNVVPNTAGIVGANINPGTSTSAPACDATKASCPVTQKLNMEVSQSGISPKTLTASIGVPVELTIDDKVPLGGCMSVWLIPKYNIIIPMNGTVSTNIFTPTETGPVDITCSMGSKLAEINIE
ncbi:MAG: sulfite exporter TauE/SafE family protein [Candidatus Pacebacteria bacterium]|nr:sulfite exporter TauE/SafE family protein [Candidatus Paceibacterota bacterium]